MAKTVHSRSSKVLTGLLREARKKAGLTQQDLAARLKQGQPFVAKYEHGDRRLDVLEFVEIARSVGVDPVALLKKLIKDAGL